MALEQAKAMRKQAEGRRLRRQRRAKKNAREDEDEATLIKELMLRDSQKGMSLV